MVVDLGVEDQSSGTNGTVAFDLSITDLNDDQDIAEPADAKPFSDLVGQFQGLLGGAAGSGSGSGGSGSGGGGTSSEDFEKFSKCIEEAGNDTQKAQKCADLLSG